MGINTFITIGNSGSGFVLPGSGLSCILILGSYILILALPKTKQAAPLWSSLFFSKRSV
jgi:hypothetical protein